MKPLMRKAFNLYGLPAVALVALMWAVQTGAPPPVVLFGLLMFGWPILGLARLEGRREERLRLTGREMP